MDVLNRGVGGIVDPIALLLHSPGPVHVFQAWDEPDTPGMAVGIVRDGKFIYRKAFGMADLERNVRLTPDHVFYMASVSKQFTAMCILLLEEQGKLKIDDEVRKHVPEFPEYGHEVTVRHLLSHTSGVRDYYSMNRLRGEDIYEFYSDEDVLATITRQKNLNFEPGSEYTYSNSGYFLLKAIVEMASGESFNDFARKNIFEPLGMKDTRFQSNVYMLVPNRALAYRGTFEAGFSNSHSSDAVVGARGLLTTLDDFRLWHENFKKNKLGKGSQKLIERMTTVAKKNDGEDLTYALGVSVTDYKGVRQIGHGGFFAGYRTRVFFYPDEKTSILVFANSYGIDASALTYKVADIVFKDKFTEPKPDPKEKKPREAKPEDVDSAALARLIGLYRDIENGAVFEVTLGDDGLRLTKGATVQKLVAEGGDKFYHPATGDEFEFVVAPERAIGFRKKPMKGKTVQAEANPRITYTKDDLKQFEGRYFSEEADVWHRISVNKKGELRIKAGNVDHKLTPNAVGDLSCPMGLFMFNRERTSYVVRGGRIKKMPFKKLRSDFLEVFLAH
ncbi:MAG: beta-lactamase family protein [Armatimonadetes bacterium]|nr:beta-lactamase family protein [Armatimonadota bacterium]